MCHSVALSVTRKSASKEGLELQICARNRAHNRCRTGIITRNFVRDSRRRTCGSPAAAAHRTPPAPARREPAATPPRTRKTMALQRASTTLRGTEPTTRVARKARSSATSRCCTAPSGRRLPARPRRVRQGPHRPGCASSRPSTWTGSSAITYHHVNTFAPARGPVSQLASMELAFDQPYADAHCIL